MGNFVLRLSEGGGRSANSGWSTLVLRITGVRPRVNSTTGGFLYLCARVFLSVSAPGPNTPIKFARLWKWKPNLARDFSLSTFRLLQEFSQPG